MILLWNYHFDKYLLVWRAELTNEIWFCTCLTSNTSLTQTTSEHTSVCTCVWTRASKQADETNIWPYIKAEEGCLNQYFPFSKVLATKSRSRSVRHTHLTLDSPSLARRTTSSLSIRSVSIHSHTLFRSRIPANYQFSTLFVHPTLSFEHNLVSQKFN